MLTDTVIEDDIWANSPLPDLAERAATATLKHLGLKATDYELCVLACGDARIAELNGDFRDKPRPTNVLSWPSQELGAEEPGETPFAPEPEDDFEPHHLGDIAITYGVCEREAAEQSKSFDAHVTHLIVHAVLHLLGYDHIRDPDATLMERLEVEILGNLGLPDPYRDIEGPQGL